MTLQSINPTTGDPIASHASWVAAQLQAALTRAQQAQRDWAALGFAQRADLLSQTATLLRERADRYALLITQEMGKPLAESHSELQKCALICDYYAVHAEPFLEAERIPTDAGKSYVRYDPCGVVLGIMPWNFPFWQVLRFVAPALMGGNAVALKHAPNVQLCAQAIEALLRDAGVPADVFLNLPIEVDLVEAAIAHPAVQAVAMTGSERTGRAVAAVAGTHLKKTVLELGGSDPFVVLDDADLELTVARAMQSRFGNAGQACIAAKRFIVLPGIADAFVEAFRARIATLRVGNPTDAGVQLGPMARADLRDELQRQVETTLHAGAQLLTGGVPLPGAGWFYAPTLIDHAPTGCVARQEELFGPVAVIIRARDAADALQIANETRYGLGASVWGRNYEHAEQFAMGIEAGLLFVNGAVKSDPRLPFGGVKASGYGRELSFHGPREFCVARTVWIREGWAAGAERRRSERRRGDRRITPLAE